MQHRVVLLIAFLSLPASLLTAQTGCVTKGLGAYAGRYAGTQTGGYPLVYVGERFGELTVRPIEWAGRSAYYPIAPDSFGMVQFSRFSVAFGRDARGCVTELRTYGYGINETLRRTTAPPLPVELLWDGTATVGVQQLMASGAKVEQLLGIGAQLARWPTRANRTVVLYEAVSRRFPENADVHSSLGNALVAAGRRREAAPHFERALALDSKASWPPVALRMLRDEPPPPTGQAWTLPFALDSVFTPAQPAEISAVWQDWNARDLSPQRVEQVREQPVDLSYGKATLRVIAHAVHGQRHYGAVFIPEGATPGCCPIVMEARGVSPSFPPLVPSNLTAPHMLGPDGRRVIIASPSYRGEGLVVGADTLWSEGDRSNAWDGATDDLLAFLEVVKQSTPEADTARVCVFGRSRGGSVALLAGMRNRSIDCTVAWAAPSEWARLMQTSGWTTLETVREGLALRARPGQLGGQAIDYFLSPALRGAADLKATRHRLFASSPLYFADRLRLTQAHWGEEDPVVLPHNGRELERRALGAGVRRACLETYYHAGSGHDMDRQIAPRESRRFIVSALFGRSASQCR